jgi:signal transduction histidine kinase
MSIRIRLTLYWAFVLAGVLLMAGEAVFLLFQGQLWGELDSALMEEAATAAETVAHLGPDSAIEIVRTLGAERDLGARRRVWLVSAGREIASAGDLTADLPAGRIGRPLRRTVDGDRHIFHYAIVPFMLAGAPAYIADGVDAAVVRNSILRLRTNLLLLLPMILAVSVAGGYWLAGRALVPINLMIAGLSEIEPRNLSHRLSFGGVDDEVTQLTRAINSLLDRVERASLAERRFAADATHELRTPLTVLRTGLEVALGRPRSTAEYADALTAALREAEALSQVADELLTLARLNEQAVVERASLDLRALVQEVAEAVEPLVHAKHLTLQTSLNGRVLVEGNSNHLRRLLINLLDNALKFTPESGRITLALDSRDAQAIMRIADSGPGIPDGDLPFIFDRFFRGKGRTEAGSGLGLSLCREIARLHGGEISVTNRAEGGAEFIVSLPLSALAVAAR